MFYYRFVNGTIHSTFVGITYFSSNHKSHQHIFTFGRGFCQFQAKDIFTQLGKEGWMDTTEISRFPATLLTSEEKLTRIVK